MDLPAGLRDWLDAGRYIAHGGHRVFVVDTGARRGDPVFILHGFPTSSHDWAGVVPRLAARTRVVTFDMLGYGLSDKPLDARYSLFEQADLAVAVAAECGLRRCTLVTHDMGQTVGAELMKRQEEGSLPFEIASAIVTNGSTFIDMARLSDGQKLLLSLPDAPLAEPLDVDALRPALRGTFSAEHPPTEADLDAMIAGIRFNGGDRLLPRLIRYVEERRTHFERWTTALTGFAPPMSVIWGAQDPIAVVDMAHRIASERPGTDLEVWDDVGHWPSNEVPERMADAIAKRL